jgi:DNA-binding response OmpR family regulator
LPTLSQAGVVLDPSKRTVTVGENKPVRLTQLEFRLMYTLITHPGQIMTTENLVEHVWGYSGERSRELVRGLVQRLRAKVEPEPRKPRYILTEPSVGYYLVRKVPDVFPPLQALEDDE